MASYTLHFSNQVGPNTTVTRRHQISGSVVFEIEELLIVYQVGQVNELFVRPRIELICGSFEDILLPDPELTGDDISVVVKDIPTKLDPGTALRIEARNASTTATRRFLVIARIREVINRREEVY